MRNINKFSLTQKQKQGAKMQTEKKHTHVTVIVEKNFKIPFSLMNEIANRSVQKVGKSLDDTDVIFHFDQFPVKDSMKPEEMPEEEWISANISAYLEYVKSTFQKGKIEQFKNLSYNELGELIKRQENKLSNEKLFEIITALKERENVPHTHFITILTKNSPEILIKMILNLNKESGESIIDAIEHKRANGFAIICYENYNDYPVSDYFRGSTIIQREEKKEEKE
jgi:hypothetical protein